MNNILSAKASVPLDTGGEQVYMARAWSRAAFTSVGCQLRSSHKQKCIMYKCTLIRIQLESRQA